MTRVVVTDRERIAIAALERIAGAGIAQRTLDEKYSNGNDVYRCPQCDEDYDSSRPCTAIGCMTAIARGALDELRRAP